METGQIWELMVIRQRHPNLLPVEVRIRQIHPTRNRDVNIPVRKCGTKKATCTTAGYTGDTYCKTCNKKLSTGKSIATKGHSTTTKTQKATASKDGKDYNHMYTVWDNDQNGKDCQGIKDKIIKDKIYL